MHISLKKIKVKAGINIGQELKVNMKYSQLAHISLER